MDVAQIVGAALAVAGANLGSQAVERRWLTGRGVVAAILVAVALFCALLFAARWVAGLLAYSAIEWPPLLLLVLAAASLGFGFGCTFDLTLRMLGRLWRRRTE